MMGAVLAYRMTTRESHQTTGNVGMKVNVYVIYTLPEQNIERQCNDFILWSPDTVSMFWNSLV